MRTLLIDNYDSYTFNVFQQLAVVNGSEPIVVANDEYSWADLAQLDVDNIVISPGPGRPEVPRDFGVCRDVLAHADIPVLGICLGHQGIAVAYGGRTTSAPRVMHGERSRVRHDSPLFREIPQGFEVVRYHSLVVAEPMPEGLTVTARADDGTVMALAARDRPLHGVQFHPESILTDNGEAILRNFRDLTRTWWARRVRDPGRTRSGLRSRRVLAAPRAANGGVARVHVSVERIDGPFDAEAVFEAVGARNPAVWLDSASRGIGTGRFSYVAAEGGELREVLLYDAPTRTTRVYRGDAVTSHSVPLFDFLSERLASRRPIDAPKVPFPFCGGYVGWVGYECKSECGGSAAHAADTEDAALLFVDRLVVLDHDQGDAYLVALATSAGRDDATRWLRSTTEVVRRLRGAGPPPPPTAGPRAQAQPARSKAQYLADIARCKELLKAGETYEVCLTNEFRAPFTRDPYELYRSLRRLNPAPYGAYLEFGETKVLSSSPECLVRVGRDGLVQAKPIKGTTRRDTDPSEDRRLAGRLAADRKERAENLMIVDLLRNDLGRVCRPGTVTVPSLMAIESFRTVHQLVSTIEGELRPGATAIDCLRSTFPGGSMTGAPKLRTMEIIDGLEGRARGVYSGAIGYLGIDGSAELSIVIRTLVCRDGWVSAGAGGAITVLSDPEEEWREVLLKANAVLRAADLEVVA